MGKFFAAAVLLLAAVSTLAFSQEMEEAGRDEIGATIGRTFIYGPTVPNTNFFDNTVHFGKGLSFEGNYSHNLRNFGWGVLSLELPVIFNPDEDLNYGLNQVPEQYSSIFITPAARVSFLRDLAISPWASFGGGVGHFIASKNLEFGGANTGHRINTSGVLQFGVGFDFKIPYIDKLRLRLEARDDWSGAPPVNVDLGKSRQNNWYVGVGPIFHF